MNFFTTIVGYTGFKEGSAKIMERDEAQRAWHAELVFFLLFFDGKKSVQNFYLLSTLDYWIFLTWLAMIQKLGKDTH